MTASTAEHFDFIKMLLRPKSLDFQGFSAAGYWNARRVLTRLTKIGPIDLENMTVTVLSMVDGRRVGKVLVQVDPAETEE